MIETLYAALNICTLIHPLKAERIRLSHARHQNKRKECTKAHIHARMFDGLQVANNATTLGRYARAGNIIFPRIYQASFTPRENKS